MCVLAGLEIGPPVPGQLPHRAGQRGQIQVTKIFVFPKKYPDLGANCNPLVTIKKISFPAVTV